MHELTHALSAISVFSSSKSGKDQHEESGPQTTVALLAAMHRGSQATSPQPVAAAVSARADANSHTRHRSSKQKTHSLGDQKSITGQIRKLLFLDEPIFGLETDETGFLSFQPASQVSSDLSQNLAQAREVCGSF